MSSLSKGSQMLLADAKGRSQELSLIFPPGQQRLNYLNRRCCLPGTLARRKSGEPELGLRPIHSHVFKDSHRNLNY